MIADKLLALRRRQGMSQQEVADAIGVTRQTISNWELGQGAPALDKAAELARLYGVTLDDFVNDDIDIMVPERHKHARDLHVLERLVGKKVTIGFVSDLDQGLLPDVRLIEVSGGWLRVECPQRSGLFGAANAEKPGAVRLVDVANVASVSAAEGA